MIKKIIMMKVKIDTKCSKQIRFKGYKGKRHVIRRRTMNKVIKKGPVVFLHLHLNFPLHFAFFFFLLDRVGEGKEEKNKKNRNKVC